MLIWKIKFAVSPITTHIDIKIFLKNIKNDLIIKKIKTIINIGSFLFKKKPNIACLVLNPHNAELRKGSFEIKTNNSSYFKLKRKIE